VGVGELLFCWLPGCCHPAILGRAGKCIIHEVK
jgi:hypothetical protein